MPIVTSADIEPLTNEIDALISQQLSSQSKELPSGAAYAISFNGGVVYEKYYGKVDVDSSSIVYDETVFDVGELTEVLATMPLILVAIKEGRLSFNKRLCHVLQTFRTHGKDAITLLDVLNHQAGFSADFKFFQKIDELNKGARTGIINSRGAVDEILAEIYRAKLEYKTATSSKYSLVDYILCQNLLEVVYGGLTLDKIILERLIKPLKLRSFSYIDLVKLKRGGLEAIADCIAAMGKCPTRKTNIVGEVFDLTAWAMGGVAGHSGIFSNLRDTLKVVMELSQALVGKSAVFNVKDLNTPFYSYAESLEPQEKSASNEKGFQNKNFVLGFETAKASRKKIGNKFSDYSFGRFSEKTGSFVWLLPGESIEIVYLSNLGVKSGYGQQSQSEASKFHEFSSKLCDLSYSLISR